MPARTNNFQKLIKVINRHFAAESATVTESALLYDEEAMQHREVDILIESKVAGYDITIGVECTEGARPLDVRGIEAFKEKHRKLKISKTVIVSKNGFTSSAKNYAKKNGIRCLTFNGAKSENWSKLLQALGNLTVYARRYALRQCAIDVNQESMHPDFKLNERVSVKLESDQRLPLVELVNQLFERSQISSLASRELMENEKRASDPILNLEFDLDERLEFRDEDGRTTRPIKLRMSFAYRSNYRPVVAEPVVYDEKEVLVGGFFDMRSKEHAHLAINESGGTINATLEISENLIPREIVVEAKKL